MWHGGRSTLVVSMVLGTVTFLGTAAPPAYSQTPGVIGEVSSALHDLQEWLGDDENARNWNRFLRSDELAMLVAQGAAADRQQISQIATLYSGATPGLEKRRFQAVRSALERWLAERPLGLAEVPPALRSARDNYHPASAEQVARAREHLTSAMGQLEAFLAQSSPENVAAWKQYLRWSDLQAELSKEAGPSAGELRNLTDLYTANYRGLELPEFAEVRRALFDLTYSVYFSQEGPAKEAYLQHLEETAKRIEASGTSLGADDLAAVGRSVGWLERGAQVPHLVASIRSAFARPNLYALASQRLIAAGATDAEVTERLNQPQAVNEVILKTSIQGTAYPNLSLSVLLVPDDDRAAFDVRLLGGASSSSVGYRGPVTVYTSGYTSIQAGKRVYIDETGFSTDRAWAACSTSSSINDIAARCRLIEKFAWKQAGKSKGQAESIASSRTSARIESRVDSEFSERLADANQSYADRFRNRLLRRDSFPQSFRLSTSNEAVYVRILHATSQQLAASTEPPALEGTHDLAVRLHESFVTNMGESLLGGLTLTDERLVEILKESKSEIPDELQITPDKDPWSITFTQEQPISASFAGNQVKLAVRGRRFTRGDQQVQAIMEISATYTLEKSGTGSKLTRQGDVSAEYVTRRRESVGEIAMKTLMRKKFEALFKPELTSDGLQLPDRLNRIGKLHLQQLATDNGWLTAGWTKPDGEPQLIGAE